MRSRDSPRQRLYEHCPDADTTHRSVCRLMGWTTRVLVAPSLRVVLVVTALVTVLLMPVVGQGQCDPTSGPAGNVACIATARYANGSQFATCRTSNYILHKSRGKHACLDDSVSYCYYQCMLEMYDTDVGPVSSDCQCTLPLPPKSVSPLPSECYSPSGANCGWYRDCLEKTFGCAGGLDDYAMAYSQLMCTLYDAKKGQLTERGHRWLNATSTCLQAELVPLLQPFKAMGCDDVKSRAYKTQASCYLQPYLDEPSVCDLPSGDLWRIFWSLRDAFRSEFVESILGLKKVASSCASRATLTSDVQQVRLRLLHADLWRQTRDQLADLEASVAEKRPSLPAGRRKRQAEAGGEWVPPASLSGFVPIPVKRQPLTTLPWRGENNTARRVHRLANEVADSLARQLGWDDRALIWFADAEQVDGETLDVHVLLADRHAFDLAAHAWTPRSDVTQLMTQAAQTISKGDVTLALEGQNLKVQSLEVCGDLQCRQVRTTVTAPTSPGGAARHPAAVANVLAVTLGMAVIMVKTV